jgi:hypothetical protein
VLLPANKTTILTNENASHSILIADIIINKIYDSPMFSWGTGDLAYQGDARTTYLKAVKEVDHDSFQPLIEFASS